jgi:hypothetical protein
MNAKTYGALPTHRRQGWAERVRQFTPNWFAMTMGNGIVYLVLAGLPWHFAGQMTFAQAL